MQDLVAELVELRLRLTDDDGDLRRRVTLRLGLAAPPAIADRNQCRAVAKDAAVFCFGDWFDLMQGMYDPRRSYSGLRPEYKSITYLDDVINDSIEFLQPYADRWLFMGRGNHETNIEKRLSTSPIDRLCQA